MLDVPVVIVESKALPANTGWNVTAHNGFGVIPTLKVSALEESFESGPVNCLGLTLGGKI